jgi:hypothetical protein
MDPWLIHALSHVSSSRATIFSKLKNRTDFEFWMEMDMQAGDYSSVHT